jgi:hypothetical protein
MPKLAPKIEPSPPDAVAAYKRILAGVLEQRPSGTRQRLAAALGKNRSFVSQICSPAYATPIPASHIDMLFDICHFSGAEKKSFLAAYALAHPRRPVALQDRQRARGQQIYLPDLGDDARNERLRRAVADFIAHIASLMDQGNRS